MAHFFSFRIRLWGLLTAAGFLGLLGSIAGFFGRFAWWMDLGSHFRVQYTILFAILTICYFAGKRTIWAGACLALTLINAIPVFLFLWPSKEYAAITEPRLKIALINVNTQRGNPEQVVHYLYEVNPDIIVLEEINDQWERRLSSALDRYPVRILAPRDDNFGIGLFARAETATTQVVYWGSAEVPSLLADLRLNQRPFRLVATHPLPPGGPVYSRYRNEQLVAIADYIGSNQSPLLLVGDLNTTPWTVYYREFMRQSGLINSSQGRALHPTWPTFCPLMWIPIDHCLHSPDIVIHSKTVGPSIGSDHFPVVVEFSIKDP